MDPEGEGKPRERRDEHLLLILLIVRNQQTTKKEETKGVSIKTTRAQTPTFLNTDIPNRTDGQHEHIKIVYILCVSMNLAHKAH